VAYITVIISWLIVALQTRKSTQFFNVIKNLPEADRLEALKLEYRTTPRAGLSAEQWLTSRRMNLIFAGFGITIFAIVLLLLFALTISAQAIGTASSPSPTIAPTPTPKPTLTPTPTPTRIPMSTTTLYVAVAGFGSKNTDGSVTKSQE